MAYEAARDRSDLAPPAPTRDPVLATFAQEDQQWAARYQALPAADREAFRQSMATGTPPSAPGLNAYFQQVQDHYNELLVTQDQALRQTLGQAAQTVSDALSPSPARTLAGRVQQVTPTLATATPAIPETGPQVSSRRLR